MEPQAALRHEGARRGRLARRLRPDAPGPPGRSDPDVPRGAKEVTVARDRAPRGSAPAGDGTALVVEGESQDLVIGSAGLTQAGLVSLVSAGLSSAA